MSPQTEYIQRHSAQETDIEVADFETLLRVSMEDLMVVTQAHQQSWHFGKEEQWQVDHERGELVLKFPGRQVLAAAQIIGEYNTENGIWKWAWANPVFPESIVNHALRVKEYGEQQAIERLTSPEWAGAETDCWYMAALAFRLCGSEGAYRGPAGATYTFFTLGEITMDPALDDLEALSRNFLLETAEEFRSCAESPDQQRQTCCRYFRRGPLTGLTQAELIDSLALSSPSVLDTAGYSAEAAQQVMDMLGGISDEEIHNS
jgi:hypothetical protein